MADEVPPFLLALPDAALRIMLEPLLLAYGAHLEVALSAQAALALMETRTPLAMAIVDSNLPGMEINHFLIRARVACDGNFPIVLITDTATQNWIDRVREGLIDDLIQRSEDPEYLQVRVRIALNAQRLEEDLKGLREKFENRTKLDCLTGVYNRETILTLLSRETDRVRRVNGTLSLLLFDLDDFGHWNSRLGFEACDELLRQVAGRVSRLLRSSDLVGRPGKDEFLLVLPDGDVSSAVLLANRLRAEVFCEPFHVNGDSVRLSACFGIASSSGRAAGALLREAEQALERAKDAGPESIQTFLENSEPEVSPVMFLSADSGDKLLAW